MLQQLIDFFFPRRSLTGRHGAWLTPEEMLRLRSFPLCIEAEALKEEGIEQIDRLVAAGSYHSSPLLRTAIHLFKYTRVHDIGSALGSLLVPASELLHGGGETVLCPVPLHWTRRFWRGFNQADILAHTLSRARGWPVEHLLTRTRRTSSQATLNRSSRLSQMNGAFACATSPSHVILVDDVATTGATLVACAAALRQAGAVSVQAIVIARS